MRILESFVGSPLAGAIGWTLLHSLWEGALISAILAAVLLATRSARIRYIAACVAMLALVAGFAITLYRVIPEPVQNFPRFRSAVPFIPIANTAPQPNTALSWLEMLAAVAPWLAPFWIIGVLLLSFQRVMSFFGVRKLRTRGICFASEEWHAELARLAGQLKISRPVHLLESCFAEIPMVLAHLRPVILMPVGLLANLPSEQVEAVLLHELAHIRRCDYLVNVFQRLVESLLFYHPAIWWISKVMRNERENCCDDIVVSISQRANDYALALAALERNRLPSQQAAVAATGGILVKRIRRLLYPKAPAGIWAPLAAALILVATAAVSFAAWPPKLSKPSQSEVQTQSAKRTFYLTNAQTPRDIDRIVTTLRQVLDSQQIEAAYTDRAIVVNNTPELITVAGKIIAAEDMPAGSATGSGDSARLRLQLQTLQNLIKQDRTTEAQPLRNTIIQENENPGQPAARNGTPTVAPDRFVVAAEAAAQGEASSNGGLARITPDNPYSKWLSEDVVYIVTDEERDTFLHLKTDEERQQFITAFWERRNPTPGSADNKFKDEHYRRIAYANQHFGTPSGKPGWQTDRGHIYIVYGPPDARSEMSASQNGNEFATEIWRYNHIEGVGDNLSFEFVSRGGNGDFALAPTR